MTDLETANLDDITLMGGWRLLCVSAMHYCVRSFVEERQMNSQGKGFSTKYRWSEGRRQKSDAEKWMDGGVGSITFEDACEAMDVLPEVARRKIVDFAHRNKRKQTRELFGEW
jgi:hypothetical protein